MLDEAVKVRCSKWATDPLCERALFALTSARLAFDILDDLVEDVEPFGDFCMDFAEALGPSGEGWRKWISDRLEEVNAIHVEVLSPLMSLECADD